MRTEIPCEDVPNKYDVGDIVRDPLLGWTGKVVLCVWSHLSADWYYYMEDGSGKHCPSSWSTYQRELA